MPVGPCPDAHVLHHTSDIDIGKPELVTFLYLPLLGLPVWREQVPPLFVFVSAALFLFLLYLFFLKKESVLQCFH